MPSHLTAHVAPPPLRPQPVSVTEPVCRLCGARLHRLLIDLGMQPLANHTVAAHAEAGATYPLAVRVCDSCGLVQQAGAPAPNVPTSNGTYRPWHFPDRPTRAQPCATGLIKRLKLGPESLVIALGSRDGDCLRRFKAADVPVLGVAATEARAEAARAAGIPTETAAFNTETAMDIAVRHGRADLVLASDVLARASDIFDFAAGFASILRPNGILVLEDQHLLAILQRAQFDAFRHDTYVYLSLQVIERLLRSVGMRAFDAERIAEHGGSLRVYACHAEGAFPSRPGLKSVRMAERFAELDHRDLLDGFEERTALAREEIRAFLRNRLANGHRIAAYGAVARGITLLNACGIGAETICCVIDPDPAKHGRRLPGGHIPIVGMESVLAAPPEDLLILPWTHATELTRALEPLRQAGTQLWTLMPKITRVSCGNL